MQHRFTLQHTRFPFCPTNLLKSSYLQPRKQMCLLTDLVPFKEPIICHCYYMLLPMERDICLLTVSKGSVLGDKNMFCWRWNLSHVSQLNVRRTDLKRSIMRCRYAGDVRKVKNLRYCLQCYIHWGSEIIIYSVSLDIIHWTIKAWRASTHSARWKAHRGFFLNVILYKVKKFGFVHQAHVSWWCQFVSLTKNMIADTDLSSSVLL